MKRNLLLMLVSVITAFGVGVAHSKECKDVNFPEQVQVEGSTLTLNGLGLRQATVLKVNVYVAALYVVKPSTDADAHYRGEYPQRTDPPLRAPCEQHGPSRGVGGGLCE